MTWSYNTALTASKDQVRLLIGDTDTTDQQLQDEEIAYLLTQSPNVYRCAAQACDTLAAKYARQINVALGGPIQSARADAAERSQHYTTLAASLRAQATRRSAGPYAGGISQADKETRESDTDRVGPAFGKKLQDYPSVPPPSDSMTQTGL